MAKISDDVKLRLSIMAGQRWIVWNGQHGDVEIKTVKKVIDQSVYFEEDQPYVSEPVTNFRNYKLIKEK